MRTGLYAAIVAGALLASAPAAAQAVPQGATVTAQTTVTAPAPPPPPPAQLPIITQQPAAYGYPPGYGYPGGVAYGAPRRFRPVVSPYTGGPVPPGAHVERRPITGLIVAGSVVFGVPYLVTLFAGLICSAPRLCGDPTLPWLMMPLAGPLIVLGSPRTATETYPVLILDAVLQVGGVAMLIAGAAAQRAVLVLDGYVAQRRRAAPARARWSVSPSGAGLAFILTTM